MKYLPFLLLLTAFACDKEDAESTAPENSVRVYVDGDLYFTQEDNLFNTIDRDINSDGVEEFDLLLFATGREDEDEDFSALIGLTSLNNPSELSSGAHSISFTQIGNDCSGMVFAVRDNFTVDIRRNGDAVTGYFSGQFSSLFGGCILDFRVEFDNIELQD